MSTSAIGNNSYLSSLYSTSTSSNTSTSTSKSTSTSGTSGLGESDFLNLLISQLKNQDPLNPISNTDFISQMANFSSLQQMTSVNTNISSLLQQQNIANSTAMIGKQVTTSDGNSGIVNQVSMDSGQVSIYVGTNKYLLSDITNIQNATTA
jgi:flagellar basal-body rod modification protein FlgD